MKDKREIFRLDEELATCLKERANEKGQNKSALIRDLVKSGLYDLDEPAIEQLKLIFKTLLELKLGFSQIGGNLNQIAYHLNSEGKLVPAELQENHKELQELFAETVGSVDEAFREIRKLI
ncbi:plasmid mobilization relaxosome protein MobC [Maridesulfovibrio sp.]|uniref:plasmid mobilization relaxosome protein MobC n=1 Tax=Maridesulfovibrio sp. TaxID=2795000 RepID=UPI002A189746|nr:ribbon-helix-helix protein, CopG family [Maridesulfovibrio sp.]